MMSNSDIIFKCIEIKQPIGIFYIGSIDSKDLVDIAYADVMRIKDRKDDFDVYLGIQRELSPGRVTDLEKYVNTVDASFPTSVILAIASENAEFDAKTQKMKIPRREEIAKIIDGQHRIAGLKNYTGDSFQVNVTIFVDMEIEDQAMVFSTVNLKQTKVNKSLSYNLYQYATTRSPQKTCHDIAKLLNSKSSSPFQNHIKILGKATGKIEETITQATFVDRLIKYLSKDPMNDRDQIKRSKKLTHVEGKDTRRLIFRNMFIDDRDAEIARIIFNYFKAVENKWGDFWIKGRTGNILNKTTGFGALMRFLRPCYLSVGKLDEIVDIPEFDKIFKKINITGNSFTPENYLPGASGENKLFAKLCEQSRLSDQ